MKESAAFPINNADRRREVKTLMDHVASAVALSLVMAAVFTPLAFVVLKWVVWCWRWIGPLE
ncbi:MAG TPA: hypothetical protein VEA69_12245 [Tepidisphaeraceae bacterium]|nr:hypothetical protein [Tepidisphaeraceae bacterium]